MYKITAAASARLCVETLNFTTLCNKFTEQPPPRGCVLKHFNGLYLTPDQMQPPPRGCVLKQNYQH